MSQQCLYLLYEIFSREKSVHEAISSHFPSWTVISIEQTLFYTLCPLLPCGVVLVKDSQFIRHRSLAKFKRLGFQNVAFDIEGLSIVCPSTFIAERVAPASLMHLTAYIVHRRDVFDILMKSFPKFDHIFRLASFSAI